MKPLMFLLGIGLSIVCLGPAQEAPDRGEVLRYWTAQLRDGNAFHRQEAADVFKEIGMEAVPPLAELLRDKDQAVRLTAAQTLRTLGPETIPGITRLLRDKDDFVAHCCHRSSEEDGTGSCGCGYGTHRSASR